MELGPSCVYVKYKHWITGRLKTKHLEIYPKSEVGGVSPSLDRPRTGKSISVAFALRACVRASEAA